MFHHERDVELICQICFDPGAILKPCGHMSHPECEGDGQCVVDSCDGQTNIYNGYDLEKAAFLLEGLFALGFRDFALELKETEKEYFRLLSQAMTPTPSWYPQFKKVAERYVDLKSLARDSSADDLVSKIMKRAKQENSLLLAYVSKHEKLLLNASNGKQVPTFDFSDLRFSSEGDFKVGIHPLIFGLYRDGHLHEYASLLRCGQAFLAEQKSNYRTVTIDDSEPEEEVLNPSDIFMIAYPDSLIGNFDYKTGPCPVVSLVTADYKIEVQVPNVKDDYDYDLFAKRCNMSFTLSLDDSGKILTLVMVAFYESARSKLFVDNHDLEKWSKRGCDIMGRVLVRVPVSKGSLYLCKPIWED